MDRQHCVKTILYECVGFGGFLTGLRAREFSHEHYQSLVKALQLYREFVRDQEFMERTVAVCLYHLEVGLSDAVEHFPRTEAEEAMIQDAYGECSTLIMEVLTPEHMTGPLPEELQR